MRISLGRVSPTAAQVFASAPLPDTAETVGLSGEIEGPFSKYATTLRTTMLWRDLGAGPTVLANAKIVDPVYWTMQNPALYHSRLALHVGSRVVDETSQEFGIRPLRATPNSFFLEGERWVLRGVQQHLAPSVELSSWRNASAAMLVNNPSNALCIEASRVGVLLVATLAAGSSDLLARAEELSQYAAVGFLMIDREPPDPAALRQAASGMMLGERFSPGALPHPAEWRDVAFVEVDDPATMPQQTQRAQCPVVAVRSSAEYDDVSSARAACDDLQRDLAPGCDLAGYLIDNQ